MKTDDQKALVSIIMPVYNGAKTIRLAINSLFAQTYENWKCVIVNDGSVDDTKNIIDSISDKRFKVIHLNQNRGRGYARQVGLENAEGEYLAYLDADDFYHPYKISAQVEILNKMDNIFLTSCAAGSFDGNFELKRVRGFKYSGVYDFHFGQSVIFLAPTSMIRLKYAQRVKYNLRLNASEDIDYFSHYLDGRHFYILNELYYFYSEFESVSYRKILLYDYNNLKSILYSARKLGGVLFLKKYSLDLFKSVLTIFLFPVLGKKFFVNRRGLVSNENQILAFNDLYSILQKRDLSLN